MAVTLYLFVKGWSVLLFWYAQKCTLSIYGSFSLFFNFLFCGSIYCHILLIIQNVFFCYFFPFWTTWTNSLNLDIFVLLSVMLSSSINPFIRQYLFRFLPFNFVHRPFWIWLLSIVFIQRFIKTFSIVFVQRFIKTFYVFMNILLYLSRFFRFS